MVLGLWVSWSRVDGQLLRIVLLTICAYISSPKLNVIFKITLHKCAKLLRIIVNFVQLVQVRLRITIFHIFAPGPIECICCSVLLSRILVISHDSDAAVRLFPSVFIA